MMAVFDSETYGDKVDFRRSSGMHLLPGGFEMALDAEVWGELVEARLYAPDGYYFSSEGLHTALATSAEDAREEMANISPCSDGGCVDVEYGCKGVAS
jgi:hypothetical protein